MLCRRSESSRELSWLFRLGEGLSLSFAVAVGELIEADVAASRQASLYASRGELDGQGVILDVLIVLWSWVRCSPFSGMLVAQVGVLERATVSRMFFCQGLAKTLQYNICYDGLRSSDSKPPFAIVVVCSR